MEYVKLFLIICGALSLLCALIWWIESECFDAPRPTNSDTLFRGKKCANCIHLADTSTTNYFTCRNHGKAVELHHVCEEWL